MSLVELPALFARAPCPPLPPPPPEQKRKQRLTVSFSAFSLRSLSCGSSRSPLWAELRVFCRPSMEAGEAERGGGVSSRASAARERAKEKAAPLSGASTGGPAVRRGPSYLGPRGGGRAWDVPDTCCFLSLFELDALTVLPMAGRAGRLGWQGFHSSARDSPATTYGFQ